MHTVDFDIAPHLERLLVEHDSLVIPGLGAFTSRPTNAAIDYLGETIAPPSKILSFDETLQSDDGIMTQYLVDKLGLAQDEARNLLTSYVNRVKETLDNREIVTLPRIGRLYKNYARKVQFLPETTNLRGDSFGLPALQATTVQVAGTPKHTPVSVGSTTSPVTETVAATVSAPPKPEAIVSSPTPPAPAQVVATAATTQDEYRFDTTPVARRMGAGVWVALGALLLVSAIGLGYWLMQRKQAKVNQTPKIEEAGIATSPVATPMDAATAAIEQEKMNQQGANAPIASPKDDMPDAVEEVTAKQIAAAKSAAEKATKPAAPAVEKPAADGKRRCVLVIGAFEDKENVDKLVAKLKANNYDTYHRRDDKNRHQIGVEFMYKDLRDVQTTIVALQKLTGIESIWIKKR